MLKNKLYIFILLIFAGFASQVVLPSVVFAAYETTGTVTSTNLLSGNSASSITNFYYNISSLPTSGGVSSVTIQFSTTTTQWYSSAGVLNGSNNLTTTGGANLGLTALNASGTAFYYKMTIKATGDQSGTPTVDDVRLDYNVGSGYDGMFAVDTNGNVNVGGAGAVAGSKLSVQGGGVFGSDYFTSTAPTNGILVQGGAGFGTTTPWGLLSIAALSSNTSPLFTISTSTASATSTAFIIDSNGKVGINTAAPSAMLDVHGATSDSTAFAFQASNSASTALFSVRNDGNIGIGTTTPYWNLQVAGTRPSFALTDTSAGTNLKHWLFSSMGGNLYIGTSTDAYATSTPAALTISNAGVLTLAFFPSIPLTKGNFLVGNDAGVAQATSTIFISSTGNVGIGTSSPLSKLSIQGTAGQDILNIASSTGASLFYINSAGNIGIGTVAPSYLLDVNGAGHLTSYLDASYIVATSSTATSTFAGGLTVGTNKLFVSNYSGNVGIGTTNPQYPLQVNGSFYATTVRGTQKGNYFGNTSTNYPAADLAALSNGTTDIPLGIKGYAGQTANLTEWASSDGTVLDVINSSGNVGIGTTSPATKLEVGGNTANVTFDGYLNCATGLITDTNGKLSCAPSDERLKQNISALDATSSLAAIIALNPVSFNWRDPSMSTSQQFGLIAQQVQSVFPNLVQATNPTALTPGGTLTVNYSGLIAPMIRSIQELDAMVKQMQGARGVLTVEVGTEAQCVTGDTRLRRRRKHEASSTKHETNEEEFDEIEIKNIQTGDEIASLDERTGRIVYSRVNALLDMGVQEIFELTTASGRVIRTTSNHPFLARLAQKVA